ncbi:ABC transporter ATP-binding protein [Marinitenerispora sediminis]|uniref:Iron ABC transporter ATP-binding protein n=1 Tax=Marinitenerispora sediminis TaxID=1931232 RepID=A0A368TBP2_9ACTN|nr:ABC transporter ATP-binding protein [Marinitenerispora sediminis]RCV53656.1 iron ABC transporter ATP-binding protein [Marinitenerispora sediminis]RCV57360.1 iron ABC transporter ATP-binding protein [Marinitenerispora sediminis]RCV62360.1 iron ABC transporter ATP-binding protein [Marinitenerispora sediminis]
MNGHVLRMSGVGVRRGDAELLHGIDWAVEEDDRWVVLGPNGAGKTTLLRVAATQLFPTEGAVEVLDERLGSGDVFELRPLIGFASAAVAGQVPDATRAVDLVISAAYGYLGTWGEEYGTPDHQRAGALLDQWGAAHLADREFGTLSEGERKRVQIARALMADPELLLLDEPAAGLDLGGREDLVRRLSALAGDIDAPALAVVTHHVEEIPPGFTHGLLLRAGRVVAAGPLESVMTPDTLSETFGLPLKVERDGDRWTARAV